MDAFKNLLHPALVQEAGAQLQRHAQALGLPFDTAAFVEQGGGGLQALELKARAMQLCDALQASLPEDFDSAVTLLQAALAPPTPDHEVSPPPGLQAGLRGWVLWPVGEFIARRGQAQPVRALAALHALTQRFTAEFAIRPFIVQHPARVSRPSRAGSTTPARTCAAWSAKAAAPACPGASGCRRWWPTPRPRCPCCSRCRTMPAPTCGAAWPTT